MPDTPWEPKEGMTRRQFLTGAAITAGCLTVSAADRLLGVVPEATAHARERAPRTGLQPATVQTDDKPKVVHVHNSDATDWDYSSGWFGDCVSQGQVNWMVDRGLKELTGTASRAAAWQALIPGYVPGQRVAIKVNLNNAESFDDSDNIIDALIEPVNSVIKGLKEIGVAESDIWVYDAVRAIPNRFRNGCDFAGVQFSGDGVNDQGFSATEKVAFNPPGLDPSTQGISQVLVGADYLINMPIMKKHCCAYVTLSFKNHFGSIEDCRAVHGTTFPYEGDYSPDYSPLVDIYQNPHFVGKTVLTIGDGLYASRGSQSSVPARWGTFNDDAPNSLFFSKDPVAIDCVMYDFLEAEAEVQAGAGDYLVLAEAAGLGVCEHRASGVSSPAEWYNDIDYVYIDLDLEPRYHAYLPLVWR